MAIKVQGSTIIDDSRNIINATQVGIATTTTSQPFQVGSGTTIIVVDNLGDLGIGTPNPTSKLTVVGDVLVSGVVTASSFSGNSSTATFATTAGISTFTSEWILGAVGSSDYTFTGPGFTGAESDPVLYLIRGQQYKFTNTMGAHPFRIQSTVNGSTGTQYNDGITNNDVSNGTLTWDVQFDAPNILYYQCTAHGGMGGKIYIIDAGIGPDVSVNTTGIITALSFRGDGSLLTGILAGVSISTNTTNQAQFITYATSTGSTTGLGVSTTKLVFNPSSGNLGLGNTNPEYIFTVTDTGTPATTGLTNCLADFTTTANSYGQINLRNTSTGTNASSDVIITANNGTDSSNFIDLGINNSGFSVGSWTINGPTDGYLYTSDTNLSIGVANANKYLSFFVGGTLISNERVRINTTGVGIGTTNPTSALTVSGSALVTGISTIGNFRVTPIGTGATVGGIGVTYYGDGSGLTNIPSADSYLFNTGITSSFSTALLGIGSTIFTFPATAGKKYVILSVNCSNVSTGNTEVNVIGAFDFNGGERSYFAYNIPIPTGTAVEVMKQPQVLNPSDRIVMRSTNYSRVGTDGIVEVYVSYQEKTSTNFFGIGISTTGFATTDVTGIYTSSTYPSVIQSIRLVNVTDSGGYPVSVQITNGLTTTRLVDNLIVPKYASVEVLDAPKRIETNSVIQLQLDQAYTISAQVSGSQITS